MKKVLITLMIIGLLVTFGFGQKISYGTIEGKLMYPSKYIPPEMILCVQEIKSSQGKTICSNSKTKGYKFNPNYGKAVYSINLPVGKYFIFSAFPYGTAPTNDMEGKEAY